MSALLMWVWNFATSVFTGMAIVIALDHDNIDFYHGKGQQMWYTFIILAPFAFARVLYLAWEIFSPVFN